MSVNVKYCGSILDPSGYGHANRSDIIALYMSQVGVTTEIIHQMSEQANYGWGGTLCDNLQSQDLDYKIKIIHLTPDLYPRYTEKGKYHIGRLFWETNKIPKEWIGPLNHIEEIWTLSEQQAQMIKDSGVTTLIKCFPQPIDTNWAKSAIPPFTIPNFGGIVFYAIFQWIDRKNPKALLTTYWKTFEGKKDVVLVLKTHRVNYTDKEFELIKADIKKWKQELGLTHYPKVILIKQLFNTQEQYRLHKAGDVLVSASRGEGNGIPYVEASLMGNPVICIDKTGVTDFFPKDIYYPVACTEAQATSVHWIPWYDSTMTWWNINQDALSAAMLNCYNNRVELKERGQKAQDYVKENLNFWTVGNKMKQRLEEIERFL